MTDRELLEKAAKAAGIEGEWVEPIAYCAWGLMLPNTWCDVWNPLEWDRDALPLAVKLRMTVRHDDVDACIAGWYANQAAPTLDGMGPWFWKEWNGKDPAAATRRAIVKAAAEIEVMNGRLNPLTLRVTTLE
ncbi:MAG: hypothetical protein ACRC7C_19725 [Beijerinckiaceae bacterium]